MPTATSVGRLCALDRGLAEAAPAVTPAVLQALLSDERAVCARADPAAPRHERGVTAASVIMDLTAARVWLAEGPPSEMPYHEVAMRSGRAPGSSS